MYFVKVAQRFALQKKWQKDAVPWQKIAFKKVQFYRFFATRTAKTRFFQNTEKSLIFAQKSAFFAYCIAKTR